MRNLMAVGLAAGVSLAVAAFLTGCGGSTVNKEAFNKIKTAAVLVYTVPPSIEYRDDPKKTDKSLLAAVAAAAARGDGTRAATLSYATFTSSLNGKLPFRVLTADEVTNNNSFVALNATSMSKKVEKPGGALGKVMSFMGTGEAGVGVAPDGLPQFGLAPYGTNPLEGSDTQKRYLVAAMKALNVDAAIVVNDSGYSFTCNACVGGAGDGSTGSAFSVAFVNRSGDLIGGVNQWFGTSGAHAVMVAYAVNPLQHETLFKTHGEKMAQVLVGQLTDDGVIGAKK